MDTLDTKCTLNKNKQLSNYRTKQEEYPKFNRKDQGRKKGKGEWKTVQPVPDPDKLGTKGHTFTIFQNQDPQTDYKKISN